MSEGPFHRPCHLRGTHSSSVISEGPFPHPCHPRGTLPSSLSSPRDPSLIPVISEGPFPHPCHLRGTLPSSLSPPGDTAVISPAVLEGSLDVLTGSFAAGYILSPLLRLVLMLGIYCLPSCDWFLCWVYTVSPPAIGSRAGYKLSPLMRLVLVLGINCLPSCDWFSCWVYIVSPPAIGSHAGYKLSPLLRLVLMPLVPPPPARSDTTRRPGRRPATGVAHRSCLALSPCHSFAMAYIPTVTDSVTD
eukprot:1195722-Prorocentrum_minimum.AAC.1